MSHDLEYGELRNKPLAYLRQYEPDYSDAQYLIKRWPKVFAMVPNTAHSRSYDYGGPYAESNYRVWKESFADYENKTWWDLGDNGIFTRMDIMPKEQKETIDSLEEYPVLDDSDASELEMEIQDENWKDYGLHDTKRDLLERADESIYDRVDALFDIIPDKVFASAYWEQLSSSGSGPEQEIYGTIFPAAFEEWDGESFDDLIRWLQLEDSIIRVNLSDAAFGPWRPTGRKGESERTLRITKEELANSLGEMKVGKTDVARLIRGDEISVQFDEDFPCESLYVQCEYPWETEEEEEQETTEAKESFKLTKVQRRSLESLLGGPRFPARRLHQTFRTLVRLGFAETRLRPGVLDGHDVGFAITDAGRVELRKMA
jgi:hypothetical protein